MTIRRTQSVRRTASHSARRLAETQKQATAPTIIKIVRPAAEDDVRFLGCLSWGAEH
jgi:hypothetical protein